MVAFAGVMTSMAAASRAVRYFMEWFFLGDCSEDWAIDDFRMFKKPFPRQANKVPLDPDFRSINSTRTILSRVTEGLAR